MTKLSKVSKDVRIAVVDDDIRTVKTIALQMRKLDCEVCAYSDPRECVAALEENPVDILVTDLSMPDMNGFEVMHRVLDAAPDTDIIVVTGEADKDNAIKALRMGAYDFFEKPVNSTELLHTIERTAGYRAAVQDRDRLAAQLSHITQAEAKRWGIDAFIGKSDPVKKIISDIRLLESIDNTSVLITGESGTGKELIARAIHFGGWRSSHPFIPVNCSAIPENLAESTLFGHKKGAFTGAVADHKGYAELAHKGTLFLDEIGDMPAAIQAKMLRFLEDQIVTPVGAVRGVEVNVRVIAATNSDLQAKMARGEFRADLFYRLATFTFEAPPLRERKSDIPLLVKHFAETFSREMGFDSTPEVTTEAMELLKQHSFPGNVRELKNVLERALIKSRGQAVCPEHIQLLETPAPAPQSGRPGAGGNGTETPENALAPLPFNLEVAEQMLVKRALAEADGNISAAARLLGVNRPKLYRMLASLEN